MANNSYNLYLSLALSALVIGLANQANCPTLLETSKTLEKPESEILKNCKIHRSLVSISKTIDSLM